MGSICLSRQVLQITDTQMSQGDGLWGRWKTFYWGMSRGGSVFFRNSNVCNSDACYLRCIRGYSFFDYSVAFIRRSFTSFKMQNFDSPAKDIKAFFLFFCVKRKKILTVQKFSIYKKLTHFLNKREESGSS